MKKFLITLSALVLTVTALPLFNATPLAAQSSNAEAICRGSGGTWNRGTESCSSSDGRTVPGTIKQITNILIFLIGAIAVLMIIIGGVRYTISSGDQSATTAAKNTILYAIVGLVVAIMSYAIVNFIFSAFNIR